MIHFNKPPLTGMEQKYVLEAMQSVKISGDGPFGKKCQTWFEERFTCKKTLLTPSCTHALEMAALLLEIKEGDEVIMPSYTFVSTADAFALRGAKIIFVDIRQKRLFLYIMPVSHVKWIRLWILQYVTTCLWLKMLHKGLKVPTRAKP